MEVFGFWIFVIAVIYYDEVVAWMRKDSLCTKPHREEDEPPSGEAE